jgi:hypothetical protein
MPRIPDEPLDNVHIRLHKSTNAKLHNMFDDSALGYSGNIRKILDDYVNNNFHSFFSTIPDINQL